RSPAAGDPHTDGRPAGAVVPADPVAPGAAGRAALPPPDRHPHAGPGAGRYGDEAAPGPHVVAGGDGGQRAHAHKGRAGGRAPGGRRAAHRPGHGRDRRAAHRGRPAVLDRSGRARHPRPPGRWAMTGLDLTWSPEEDAFRDEAREWLESSLAAWHGGEDAIA